jgi:predicted lipase
MNLSEAIEMAQLVNAAYAIPPSDLTNSAGKTFAAGGTAYTVVTTIYANDLATDVDPDRGKQRVSIGLICQANGAGDAVIAIRGTEGTLEWVHDAEFLLVPCPFLPGAGNTEDGFTAMYKSMETDVVPGSPSVASALATLPFKQPVTSLSICGHSLGGALATLLALDVAANLKFPDPVAYTYASPRVGDPLFAATYNQIVKNSFRIANRLDLVPKLPLPPAYEHVDELYELNPIQLLPLPPKILVNPTLACEHSLNSYLHLLSRLVGTILPLDPQCKP